MQSKNIISHSFGIVALFTSLFISAAPIPVDMTNGVWAVTAFDTAGTDWSESTLIFDTQSADNDNWLLTGYFDWIGSNGAFGRENFTGTLFSDRSLELSGFELVDSSGLITGDYFADLALSNNDIVDGTWQSDVPFIPTNGWTATRAVPVPAAVWLFGSGLIGLVGMARRKKA